MKIALVSLYTTEHSVLNDITAESKSAYAARWGYDFINHFGSLDEARPPAWSKIQLLLRNLDKYDWLYWIDADAMIMNPDIRLEVFLDDVDMVIAQEAYPSHYGNYQFNTGSFFLRNAPWSRKMLESAWEQIALRDHLYWDQAAIRHVLDADPDANAHVKIEIDSRRFNAFVGNYHKGDFAFHAFSFTTDVEAKRQLLTLAREQDKGIPGDTQADIPVHFFVDQTDPALPLLHEIALPDLIAHNRFEGRQEVLFIETTPSELSTLGHGISFSRLKARIDAVAEQLRRGRQQTLCFARPDTQFLDSRWRRMCLETLGIKSAHCLALENGRRRGEPGDALLIIESCDEAIAYFEAAARYLRRQEKTRKAGIDSFAQLIRAVEPGDFGFRLLSFPAQQAVNSDANLETTHIFRFPMIFCTECVSQTEAKRDILVRNRNAKRNATESLGAVRKKT